jgi:plasmid stabilization system protein ParE
MLVELSERSIGDLLEVCAFLGSSARGEELVRQFEAQLANLRRFPEMGMNAHPLAGGGRAVLLGRTGYLMTYEIRDDRLIVFRIIHASRDPA